MQTGQPSQHTRRPPSPHTAHTSPCSSSARSDFSLGAGGGGCGWAGGVLVALGVAFAAKGDDEDEEEEDEDDAAAAAARAAFGLKDDGADAAASGDDDVLSALAALANTLDSRILSLGRRSRRALPSLPPLIVAASTAPIKSNAESTMGAVVVPASDTASLPTKADEDAAVGDEADEGATDNEEEEEEEEAAVAAAAGGTRGRNGFVRTRKAAIRRAAPRRLIHSGGKSQRPG